MEETEAEVEVESSGWGCPPSPPSKFSGWPSFPSAQFPTEADLHYSSPDVQAWSVGNQMQLDVVNQVKHFFNHNNQDEDSGASDSEDSDSEDSDSDSDSDSGANGDCSGFFSKLFEDNKALREFYVENHEKGEFGCLVCGGVGFIKRFKDCVALVQHTVSISKTKKMKAHRGFGHVVCKVLGWDINKLPSFTHQDKITYVPETRDKALTLPQIAKDAASIATNLKENAPHSQQVTIQALPGNGGNAAVRDVNGNNPAELKRKEEATGNDKLPTIHISNHAQEHCKEDGNGKNESEDSQ